MGRRLAVGAASVVAWCVLLSCAGLARGGVTTAFAQARAPGLSARQSIPSVLEPWIPWVLEGHEEWRCPVTAGAPTCLWPSKLELHLDATGGRFVQQVHSDRALAFALPGSAEHWPEAVTLNGRAAVVLAGAAGPVVELSPGTHRIEGRLVWRQLPEILQISASTALVALEIGGERVPLPKRDAQGRLWLQRRGVEDASDAHVHLDVTRRMDDGSPFRVTTRLHLRVSGRTRELSLGQVLLAGTSPLALHTALPARLDAAGHLTVQVPAGSHIVEIQAISPAPLDRLQPAVRTGTSEDSSPLAWPREEYWVWSADDSFRHVSLSGAAGVDPARTPLEPDWRHLPAYVVRVGEALHVSTLRRGEPEPPPNELRLQRDVWLDLDGEGYTVRDHITGSMQQDWRLDLHAGNLARVTVGGQDQLITKGRADSTGVELRDRHVELMAEWRGDARFENLPAVGWSEDVQHLSTTLHLPPGWSVLSASGVEQISDTWLARWDLLGFFFVLVVALAVAKVASWGWGAVALAALTLSHHELEAPHLTWLWLLGVIALLRVMPLGMPRRLLLLGGWVAAASLVISLITFATVQMRIGLFPQTASAHGEFDLVAQDSPEWLQERWVGEAAGGGTRHRDEEGMLDAPQAHSKREAAQATPPVAASVPPQASPIAASPKQEPHAVIQTGFGVPNWAWKHWQLHWSGPVQRDQSLRLWLISPLTNGGLAFGRVLLLGLLALCLLRLLLRGGGSTPTPSAVPTAGVPTAGVPTAMLMFLALALGGSPVVRADFPDARTLESLRTRLTQPPTCAPDCVAMPRLSLHIEGDVLHLGAEVHAGAATSVALPGPAEHWVAANVRLNHRADPPMVVLEDGFVHVRLEAGVHRLEMTGPLPGTDGLTLAFGTLPRHVSVRAISWDVEGVREDGRPQSSLQLRRQLGRDAAPALESAALPPWLEVHRIFEFDTRWSVHTTVRRVSPTGMPLVVKLPLLPGEAVNDSEMQVEEGHLVMALERDQAVLQWRSQLSTPPKDAREQFTLTAPRAKPWSETWTLRCGRMWRCQTEGLAPVRHHRAGVWEPLYRPWPGESLHLTLEKTVPADGRSTTVDVATLDVWPGTRMLKASLALQLRSSTAGTQRISLPEDARVQSLTVDGTPRPLRTDGLAQVVAVQPGTQHVTLEWLAPRSASFVQEVPPVSIAGGAANVTAVVHMPEDRWLLWAQGPAWGPAVLFWGYALLVFLLALVLPRVPGSPLRAWQWALLGVGLTQVPAPVALVVVAWFFLLAWRARGGQPGAWAHDFVQLALLAWTAAALMGLYMAVHRGLLVQPDMQVAGADSHAVQLRWYVDRVPDALPMPMIVSVPMWVWKLTMLGWSLWLAASMVRWLPWAWRCYSTGGPWKRLRRSPAPAVATAGAQASVSEDPPVT